jgi:hypothetical protein
MERGGMISKSQLDAWKKGRNQVAHGNLFDHGELARSTNGWLA